MSIQRRNSELVDLLRPDFVGNDGTASPTFVDEFLTGSHRASVSIGVRAYNDANLAIPNAVMTTLTFNSERWDDPDDNQHSVFANTSRLTCQFDGIYVIGGSIRWDARAGGVRTLAIWLNATNYIARTIEHGAAAIDLDQTIATTYKLTVGDFVELRAYQNAGAGNLNIISVGNYSPEFSMVRVA